MNALIEIIFLHFVSRTDNNHTSKRGVIYKCLLDMARSRLLQRKVIDEYQRLLFERKLRARRTSQLVRISAVLTRILSLRELEGWTVRMDVTVSLKRNS